MKKKVQLLLAMAMLLLAAGILMIRGNQKLQLELSEDDDLDMLLTENYKQHRIYPWYNKSDGVYYFFLPAYCTSDDISFKVAEDDKAVLLNGMSVRSGSKFEWQEGTAYHLDILTESASADYDIIIMQSANLPTVFVETDSGNMEYIHQDKENEEQGYIDIIKSDGNTEYSGRLSKISGRGNSTWNQIKKPYSIELQEDKPLLGMDSGNKWYLLSCVREGTKMNNKVAFDIAELLGLDYSTQCTWTDLYLNGEYEGIYLLAESVSVGQGRVNINDLEKQNKSNNPNIEEADTFNEDGLKGYVLNNSGNISGGYLFEKDFIHYWTNENAGFMDSNKNTFTIKSPQHASKEQVEYLFGYVQSIDDMLDEGNTEYRNYIDFETFARKFIVDEIALSYDVNVTSMFYYKKQNDNLLYAGPVWDFDMAFGEAKFGDWLNYEYPPPFPPRDDSLDWYTKLYDDEEFRSRVIGIYSDALPRMEELVETKIDIYADYIRKSVELDSIRWQEYLNSDIEYPGYYTEFDDNVRYLKFFLAKRINYLNETWDIDYDDLELPNHEGTHKVSFWLDGELIETREVADGEILEELPYLSEDFVGWCFPHSGEKYWPHCLPIYEDTALYAKRIKNNT